MYSFYMLQNLFLGMSLAGAEWVLYLLLLLSVVSVAVIFERALFYRRAGKGLDVFRSQVRQAASQGKWEDALQAARKRAQDGTSSGADLESGLTAALLAQRSQGKPSATVLTELAQDEVTRARLHWEKNLSVLATIGSNAPFIGLFGTVLGIIKAFHDLSTQAATGTQTISAGISEALVATAVGILVAVPAVVCFNLFQRKVKAHLAHAEAMKSFLVGKLTD